MIVHKQKIIEKQKKTVSVEFRHGDLSCPSDVYEHQGKYYLPVIPSQNISCANGGQGKLKGKTTWDAVRIIQQDDGPYLGKGIFLNFSSHLTHFYKQHFLSKHY